MVDKFRKTHPLRITFSEGEQPTAQKLSAIAQQSRNGSDLLERAIGDIWSSSGDEVLADFPLQIPNLARLLGENKYLNPALVPLEYSYEFDDHVGAKFIGEVTGHLNWKPETGSTPTQIDGGGQFGVGSRKDDEWLVGDPNNGAPLTNEWYVSEDTGKFRVDSPLLGGEILRVTVDPDDHDNPEEVLPGIIPDPRQAEFTSCRVSQEGANYLIHLPPRRPLAFSASIGGHNGAQSRPDKYPIDAEISDTNNFGTVAGPPFKYWQTYTDGTTLALAHEHYRYRLPKEILDAHSTLTIGDEYPGGFLYLYDKSTGTIIDDVVFRKPVGSQSTNKWVIQVESATYDFSAAVSATEEESNYNSTDLVLITVGGSVARNLWSVTSRLLQHKHDNTGDDIAAISHSELEDVNPPTTAYVANDHNLRYPTNLPRWSPSRWEKDVHTSLLSRGGSQGTAAARRRDPNDNAMLGNLVIANSQPDSNNVFLDSALADGSFKLAFGANDGPNIWAPTANTIQITGTDAGTDWFNFTDTESDASLPLTLGVLSEVDTTSVISFFSVGALTSSATYYFFAQAFDVDGNPGLISSSPESHTLGGIDNTVIHSIETDVGGAHAAVQKIRFFISPANDANGTYSYVDHVVANGDNIGVVLWSDPAAERDGTVTRAQIDAYNDRTAAAVTGRLHKFDIGESESATPVSWLSGNVYFGANVLPTGSGTLGSSTHRWGDAYIQDLFLSDEEPVATFDNTSSSAGSIGDRIAQVAYVQASNLNGFASTANLGWIQLESDMSFGSFFDGVDGTRTQWRFYNSRSSGALQECLNIDADRLVTSFGGFFTQTGEIRTNAGDIWGLNGDLNINNITMNINGGGAALTAGSRTITQRYGGGSWRPDGATLIAPGGFRQAVARVDTSSTGFCWMPLQLPESGTIKEMRCRFRLNGAPAGAGIKVEFNLLHAAFTTSAGSADGDFSFFARYTGTSTANQTATETQDHTIQAGHSYAIFAQCISGTGVTSIDLAQVEIDIETTEGIAMTLYR